MGKFIDCSKSERDKKVAVRIQIMSNLYENCDALNKGDRQPLSNTLKYIHNVYQNGYTVNAQSDYKLDLFHHRYTKDDGMILIEEDSIPLIVIVKLKSGLAKGEWRPYELDESDFRYDADLRAEAQAEQDAENAHETYYDYKASFDDPRGY